MAKTSGCFKGCALGCGGLFLVGLLFVGGALLVAYGISSKAIESRETLEATYPDQSEFTPRVDGSIPDNRIERFLTVRRQLMPFCPGFTELGRGMEEIDARAEELDASDDVGPADLFDLIRRVGRISGGMAGVGNRLAEYSLARNEALLDQEMGLGEYTWIYVVAYFSWLQNEPAKFVIADEDYPRIFRGRILGNMREMLRRQVEEMESEGLSDAFIEPWRAELDALDADPLRVPFTAGLPLSLESSLVPFRGGLEDVYCSATAELDYMRTEGRGIAHDHE